MCLNEQSRNPCMLVYKEENHGERNRERERERESGNKKIKKELGLRGK